MVAKFVNTTTDSKISNQQSTVAKNTPEAGEAFKLAGKPIPSQKTRPAGIVIYEVKGDMPVKVIETMPAESKAKGMKIWTITKRTSVKTETYSIEVSQRLQYLPNKPIYIYKSSVKTVPNEKRTLEQIGDSVAHMRNDIGALFGGDIAKAFNADTAARKKNGYNPDGTAAQLTGGGINAGLTASGGWIAGGVMKVVTVLPKVAGAIEVAGQVASKLPFASKAVEVVTHPIFHKGVIIAGAAADTGFTYHAASTGDFKTATSGLILGGAGVVVAGKLVNRGQVNAPKMNAPEKTVVNSPNQQQVTAELTRRRLAKLHGGADISVPNTRRGQQVYAQPTPAGEYGDVAVKNYPSLNKGNLGRDAPDIRNVTVVKYPAAVNGLLEHGPTFPLNRIGKFRGAGHNKKVSVLKGTQSHPHVVATDKKGLKNFEADMSSEVRDLREIKNMGIPTVRGSSTMMLEKGKGIRFSVKAFFDPSLRSERVMIMEAFPVGSKNSKHWHKMSQADWDSRINNKTLDNLILTRKELLANKKSIKDAQYMLFPNGEVILIDPLYIYDGINYGNIKYLDDAIRQVKKDIQRIEKNGKSLSIRRVNLPTELNHFHRQLNKRILIPIKNKMGIK
jgi:hypothetical protein